jgi:hypothetical protein
MPVQQHADASAAAAASFKSACQLEYYDQGFQKNHRHVGFIDVSRLREDEGTDILILEASVVNEHFHSWCILGK